MIARSRRHLHDYLQGRMTGTSAGGTAEQPPPGDTEPIKTYLVEVRGDGVAGRDPDFSVVKTLRTLVSEPYLKAGFPARVHSARERGLVTIEGRYRGGTPVSMYADCRDPRHWLIHTLAPGRTADWAIGRMAAVGTRLSRVSMPGQLLEKLAGLGLLEGLILSHDRRQFDEGEGYGAEGFMSMQLWGGQSGRILSMMSGERSLSDSVSLSRVHVRYWPHEDDRAASCLAEIDRDGRMVTRGTSYEGHLHLVKVFRRLYTRQIDNLESHFRVRADGDAGKLVGRCLTIRPARPIGNSARFCEIAFSGTPPFRLWGVPAQTSGSFTRVRALDLDVGGALDCEITPEFLRVFLLSGTSANSVVRFLTNLQHYFDSGVRLLDQDGQDVLEL